MQSSTKTLLNIAPCKTEIMDCVYYYFTNNEISFLPPLHRMCISITSDKKHIFVSHLVPLNELNISDNMANTLFEFREAYIDWEEEEKEGGNGYFDAETVKAGDIIERLIKRIRDNSICTDGMTEEFTRILNNNYPWLLE